MSVFLEFKKMPYSHPILRMVFAEFQTIEF
jgi:hypothetical protein